MGPRVCFPSRPGDWYPGLVPPWPPVPSSDGLPLQLWPKWRIWNPRRGKELSKSWMPKHLQSKEWNGKNAKPKRGVGGECTDTVSQQRHWSLQVSKGQMSEVHKATLSSLVSAFSPVHGAVNVIFLSHKSTPSPSSEAPTDSRLRSESPQHRPSSPWPC